MHAQNPRGEARRRRCRAPARRPRTWRLVVAGVALAAAASAGEVSLITSTGPAAAEPSAARPVGGPDSGSHQKLVRLRTGDRLLVRTDTRGAVRAANPVRQAAQTFRTILAGGRTYVVPSSARAKLASGAWTMAQFDVSALAAGKPGVDPGADLAHPDFPMRTVTINVTDPAGKPATNSDLTTTDLVVVNVDDSRKYQGLPEVVDGQVRISVPDGHYALLAAWDKSREFGGDVEERFVFDDFTVAGKAISTTVALADATHQVTFRTPRPADPTSLDFVWKRGSSETEGAGYVYSSVRTDHPVYMSSSETGPGVQHFYVHATLTSPPSAARPYLYDVEFPSADGTVGADQDYQVRPAGLAEVDSSYYSDHPNRLGDGAWAGVLPWEDFNFRFFLPMTMPLHRTEYLTARPDLAYQEGVDAVNNGTHFGGFETNGFRLFEPGERLRAEWFRGPNVPGLPADTGLGDYACGACRVDDTLSIRLARWTDSTADHAGVLDIDDDATMFTSHFRLFQAGTKIADRKNVTGGDFAVAAGAASYRMVYDQTRTASWTSLSTKTHTVWTFSSAHSGTTTVPAGWSCTEDFVRKHCSPVSLLLPHYELAQGLDGTEPAGRGSLTLTVGHAPGAARVPVGAATVSVSFDGGASWTAASVKGLGGNRFRARWSNPGAGTVSLRITAKDAAGASIDQTVDNAVTIGGAR